MHTYPWNGTTDVSLSPSPPIFTPNNCPVPPVYTARAMRECLRGRRVFMAGNSVGRGYAFELQGLLSGKAAPSRQEAKTSCTKPMLETRTAGFVSQELASCTLDPDSSNISISYLSYLYHDSRVGGRGRS